MIEAKPGDAAAACVEHIIKKRRSTRHFTDDPVGQETLLRLVEAGTFAPSGSNTQNQRFLIVTDPQEIAKLDSLRFVWPYKSSARRRHQKDRTGILAQSAALILVFSDNSLTEASQWGEYHVWQVLNIQNCSAAIENILIMATALGLGSCWVSAGEAMNHTRLLSHHTWREALSDYDIPPEYGIQGIILIGQAKTLDPQGFPAGEGMHGVDWSSTAREPVEDYLIGRGEESHKTALGGGKKLFLRFLSQSVRTLLALVKLIDRTIARIELGAVAEKRGQD